MVYGLCMMLCTLVLAAVLNNVFSQELSSTLYKGQPVYPGQEITFTCVTRGSSIIAWSSEEYIGPGGAQLEFGTFYSQGHIERSKNNPNTSATLVSINETTLNSTLRIRTLSDFPNASVTCHNVGLGTRTTITFQLKDRPDPTINCILPEDHVACPEEVLTFTCVANDSLIISWASEEYIGSGKEIQFSIHDTPGSIKRCQHDPNTVATFISCSCVNGIPILTIQLNITVSTTIQLNEHNVTCVNSALDTKGTYSFHMAGMCDNTSKNLMLLQQEEVTTKQSSRALSDSDDEPNGGTSTTKTTLTGLIWLMMLAVFMNNMHEL